MKFMKKFFGKAARNGSHSAPEINCARKSQTESCEKCWEEESQRISDPTDPYQQTQRLANRLSDKMDMIEGAIEAEIREYEKKTKPGE